MKNTANKADIKISAEMKAKLLERNAPQRVEFFKKYKYEKWGKHTWIKKFKINDTVGWYVELYDNLDQYRVGNIYKSVPTHASYCKLELEMLNGLMKKAAEEYDKMCEFVKTKNLCDALGLDFYKMFKLAKEKKK